MTKNAHKDIGYRNEARRSLERAQAELNSNDDDRLPYAALELRFAMEAITYDRAQAFKDELPYEEYSTWQPRKLVAVLADLDPSIMRTTIVSIGRQDEAGISATKMTTMGADVVLSAADIKRHYDALGSNLHIPTMAQVQNDEQPDPVVVRARCEETTSTISRVLSSRVWNTNFRVSSHIDCFRCNNPMRRRMPHGVKTLKAECFECKAQYTIEEQADGKVRWTPVMEEAPCANANCTGKIPLWPDEVKPGTWWTCKQCGSASELQLRVVGKGSE